MGSAEQLTLPLAINGNDPSEVSVDGLVVDLVDDQVEANKREKK